LAAIREESGNGRAESGVPISDQRRAAASVDEILRRTPFLSVIGASI
jgi:hypothetical protein